MTADVDDVRGAVLAALNAAGLAATIVGVPVLVARRLVGADPQRVVPVALAVGVGLTVATRRSAWALVTLWLGIGQGRGGAPAGGSFARRARSADGRRNAAGQDSGR